MADDETSKVDGEDNDLVGDIDSDEDVEDETFDTVDDVEGGGIGIR